MSYKEIPALLNSCKSVAKAYHSSVNFARAFHEADMDAKRNRLSPAFVDKLLFLSEAHLLGICSLDWK